MLNADELDQKIITLLSGNCKLSSQQLSDTVGASTASVWRRIKALEEAAIIYGYEAQINYEKLGFELTAFAHITLNRHSRDHVGMFEEAVQKMPEILTCHAVTGQYDYILQILVTNVRDYELFLNDRIFQAPGVDHVYSSISLKTIKSGQRKEVA